MPGLLSLHAQTPRHGQKEGFPSRKNDRMWCARTILCGRDVCSSISRLSPKSPSAFPGAAVVCGSPDVTQHGVRLQIDHSHNTLRRKNTRGGATLQSRHPFRGLLTAFYPPRQAIDHTCAVNAVTPRSPHRPRLHSINIFNKISHHSHLPHQLTQPGH